MGYDPIFSGIPSVAGVYAAKRPSPFRTSKASGAEGFMWAEDDEWLVVLYATLVNQAAITIVNTRDVLDIDSRIKAEKSKAAEEAAQDF